MQKFDKLLNYSFFTSDYHLLPAFNKMRSQTRLHSSRMRNARALPVSPSMLCARGSTRGLFTLGGGVSTLGVSTLGGVYSGGGGVCSWGGCLLPGGLSAPGGWCLLPGGCGIPACTEADTPPVNRITHACENITLPQLRCGR